MGKIRLKDLARSMKVPEQDLMFKLRSLGVRIEGEDAVIDSENIQAILLGKRLAQPREVILRDDEADAAPPQPVVRQPAKPKPAARPGGPRTRRSMIQRVDAPIQELPIGHKQDEAVAEERPVKVAETTVAATPAPEPAEAEAPKAEAPKVQEAEAAPAKETAGPEPEAPKAAAPEAAKPKAQEAKPAKAAEPPKAAAAPKKAAAPAASAKPAAGAKPEAAKPKPKEAPKEKPRRGARLIERGNNVVPPSAQRPPASARPGGGPGGRNRRGRIERMDDRRQAGRSVGGGRGRGPGGRGSAPRRPPEPPPPQLKPASERGKRRAQRRVETAGQTDTEVMFRDSKPDGPVTVTQHMTVREFSEKLGVKAKDLIKTLFSHGVMATINHVIDPELAKTVADDLGIEIMEVSVEEEVLLNHESDTPTGDRDTRAPVVTVMGHVDHGKTTLLDAIRSSNVVSGEAGGITQHIGAYLVEKDARPMVFLDTPGHEAFTMMRARGAKVTDLVVLVVAADDGVMPQTVEAIDHAKAGDVPIIVAVNKIDKANANPDRVKKELADRGLLVEDWGGDVVSVPMSALKGEGIQELEEMILLTSEMLELKATPSQPAQGVVLEARKEIGRGIIATVLVQDGTLSPGDVFVAGSSWGKVRSMLSDRGQRLNEAGPSTPVEVTGFSDVPSAGDLFQVFTDEGKARNIAERRAHEDRQRELAPKPARMSLEQLFSKIEEEEIKELPIIVKADVQGSVEVLKDALTKLSTDKVKINILHASPGGISINDVIFASASNAIIVGFNVRPERKASAMAEKEQVEIRFHTVIYELIDELKRAMAGLLEPTFKEVHSGTAEIRETFKVPKVGVIAGCYITDGVIPRNAEVRLLRDNVVIYEGKISSLRRFKDDVSEVRNGFECGIGLESYQDFKPGDSIEAFIREEVAATL